MRRAILLFITGTMVILLSGGLAAGSDENGQEAPEKQNYEWHVGPRLGISMFTSAIGLEAQKAHFAFSLGYPETAGLKYYFTPSGHSGFLGVFFSHWEFYDDEGDRVTRTHGGIGWGYRWRWGKGWDLELGLAGLYVDREEDRLFYTETEEYYAIIPFIAAGYSF